jgi:dipeptidase D
MKKNMNDQIAKLNPKEVWENFVALNAVPRPSKKEEKVRQFMLDFGKKLGLETFEDKIGNVIIKKPATPGMENRKTVALQSHLDMVPQKNKGTDHDFEKDGIDMLIDGDWVTADGTTLGADNGIGVAAIMGLLASKDIPHPPLEALFTIDEETGMTGAQHLQEGILDADIMLNLDTEEDDEIDIGCAGGIDITAKGTYEEEKPNKGDKAYQIKVKGLTGGHSGMDIHLYRGNANKILNRLLYKGQQKGLEVAEIHGGGLRNAIPREAEAIVVLPKDKAAEIIKDLQDLAETIKVEQAKQDPNLTFEFNEVTLPETVMHTKAQDRLIKAVYGAHNGVYRMSPDMEDLVETSNNVASVNVANGQIQIDNLTRSSVESTKEDLANALKSVYELGKLEVEMSGSYPGWKPNPKAQILGIMTDLYKKLYNEAPKVVACHAGLECGIIKSHYPNMEMISFGPTIQGAHSPDERVNIESVQKFWNYLKETLKNIPEKA